MSNNCSNCYNGCTQICSDKCVKYTGVDVPVLGIQNGDSLSYVEQSIIGFLTSTLDGTGIFPVVPPTDICPSLQAELDDCNPLSLNNYLTGIVKFLCSLEEQITNSGGQGGGGSGVTYDLNCIAGTISTPDPTSTEAVLQAVIDKVCLLAEDLTNFITFVDNTYVKISEINTYIENYIQNDPSQQLIANRMVPFSIVAGSGGSAFLNNFDASGAGVGDWVRIFLCNGNNGTPDLRGRALIGTNDGSMLGPAMSPIVEPSSTNPTYSIGSTNGLNAVALVTGELPAHTHSVTDPEHTHTFPARNGTVVGDYIQSAGGGAPNDDTKQIQSTASPNNITSSSATNISIDATGGGQAHINYQPGLGVYYIIYIP